jgi:hypothetical protein
MYDLEQLIMSTIKRLRTKYKNAILRFDLAVLLTAPFGLYVGLNYEIQLVTSIFIMLIILAMLSAVWIG